MNDEIRGGSKERSPNYPAVGLPDALEAANKLWQTEKRTPVPPEVAVQAMGYSGLSGASRTLIAALRQYGLVESRDGSVAISDLAVDILVHDVGSTERNEAIKKAANAPEIFRDLAETHAHASDSAITAYLISKRRFSPDGARKLVRSFRETAALTNRTPEGSSQARGSDARTPSDDMAAPQAQTSAQVLPGQRVTVMQFPLGGDMRAEIRFIGGIVEPLHIETLEAYLKVTSKALGNSH